MKKMLAIALSLAMLMSTAAMAAGAGTNESAVTATYVDGNDSAPIVYSVKIDWEDLDITYYEESHATWDPDTLTYNDDYQAEGWAEDSVANVTMSNRSNTDILATFSYTANEGFDSVDMNFAASQVYIASAEDGTEKTAANSVSPEGKLPEDTDEEEIGTITITIERCKTVKNTDITILSQNVRALKYSDGTVGYASTSVKRVENASEAAPGELYYLVSEYNAAYATLTAAAAALTNLENGTGTQAQYNEAYYAACAAWDNFLNTQVYTKA